MKPLQLSIPEIFSTATTAKSWWSCEDTHIHSLSLRSFHETRNLWPHWLQVQHYSRELALDQTPTELSSLFSTQVLSLNILVNLTLGITSVQLSFVHWRHHLLILRNPYSIFGVKLRSSWFLCWVLFLLGSRSGYVPLISQPWQWI